MIQEPEIWQEYECPITGMDFDLEEAELVAVGDRLYCSGCGAVHAVTSAQFAATYLRLAPDGELEYRATPKDAAEKAAWRAEIAAAKFRLAAHQAQLDAQP